MKMYTRDELMKMTRKELLHVAEIEMSMTELSSSTKARKKELAEAIYRRYRSIQQGEMFSKWG